MHSGRAPGKAVQVETHQVDPGLKALGFNQLKVHPFQRCGFRLSTCTPTTRGARLSRWPVEPGGIDELDYIKSGSIGVDSL